MGDSFFWAEDYSKSENFNKKERLVENMALLEKIQRSEEQIKSRKFTKADTLHSDEEIDDLLVG